MKPLDNLPVHFLWPDFLWGLLVLPLLVLLYAWLMRRRRQSALRLSLIHI